MAAGGTTFDDSSLSADVKAEVAGHTGQTGFLPLVVRQKKPLLLHSVADVKWRK